MKKIKFRAWDENQKIMFQNVETGRITIGDFFKNIYSESKNCIFMQFIGLYDKNGKEIYEGDILKEIKELSDTDYQNRIGIVNYSEEIASFIVLTDNGWCHLNYGELGRGTRLKFTEVIGNIHENPELITK